MRIANCSAWTSLAARGSWRRGLSRGFELDRLIGAEPDIELLVSNPALRERARDSLRAGGH